MNKSVDFGDVSHKPRSIRTIIRDRIYRPISTIWRMIGFGRRPGFGQLRHGGHDKPSRPFFSRPQNVNDRKANPRRKVIFGVIGMESRALSELTSEGPLCFPNYWNAWKWVRGGRQIGPGVYSLENEQRLSVSFGAPHIHVWSAFACHRTQETD